MSSRISRPREYCGAKPPEGRETATCILSAHSPEIKHRNLDGLRWWSEEVPTK